MAFSVTQSIFNADANTFAVDMPATVDSGDLLILLFEKDGSTPGLQDPSGWTNLWQNAHGGQAFYACWYKSADGSEGGTTVTVAINGSETEEAVAQVYRITNPDGTPTNGGINTGNSSSPDGGSLTGLSSDDYLAIASFGHDDTTTVTGIPSGYSDGVHTQNDSSNGVGLASCVKEFTGTSEDPGTWSLTGGNRRWAARTIAVPVTAGGTPATVTPGSVDAAVTVPGPTVTGAAAVAPAAVAASGAVPGPTALGAAAVSPGQVDAAASVDGPTVAIGASVSPGQVDAAVTVDTPSLVIPATVTPGHVDAVVTIPQPTTIGDGTDVAPATVDAAVSVLTPSPAGAGLVTPGTAVAVVTAPTPVTTVDAEVSPGTAVASVVVPAAAVSGGAAVAPAVILLVASMPKPTLLGVVIDIVARQRGRFYRYSGRLALVPLGRSLPVGFRSGEGWERVSSVFLYDEADGVGDHDAAMEAVAAAWAAEAGSDAATLLAAIDTALQSAGFRDPAGADLT